MVTQLTKKGKLLFVVNQPKMSYYQKKHLFIDAIDEFGRKQHISDMIITIGKNCNPSMPIEKFNIAHNEKRKGMVFFLKYNVTIQVWFFGKLKLLKNVINILYFIIKRLFLLIIRFCL